MMDALEVFEPAVFVQSVKLKISSVKGPSLPKMTHYIKLHILTPITSSWLFSKGFRKAKPSEPPIDHNSPADSSAYTSIEPDTAKSNTDIAHNSLENGEAPRSSSSQPNIITSLASTSTTTNTETIMTNKVMEDDQGTAAALFCYSLPVIARICPSISFSCYPRKNCAMHKPHNNSATFLTLQHMHMTYGNLWLADVVPVHLVPLVKGKLYSMNESLRTPANVMLC